MVMSATSLMIMRLMSEMNVRYGEGTAGAGGGEATNAI